MINVWKKNSAGFNISAKIRTVETFLNSSRPTKANTSAELTFYTWLLEISNFQVLNLQN